MEDIEKYMPRINENVTADMWDGVKVDGKIFMIPQTGLQFTGDHNNKFVIRGDLLEKYGMSEIKTADDLIEYWDNVVEHDRYGSHSYQPVMVGLVGNIQLQTG